MVRLPKYIPVPKYDTDPQNKEVHLHLHTQVNYGIYNDVSLQNGMRNTIY